MWPNAADFVKFAFIKCFTIFIFVHFLCLSYHTFENKDLGPFSFLLGKALKNAVIDPSHKISPSNCSPLNLFKYSLLDIKQLAEHKEIYKLGLKHGMKLAAISGVNGAYTEEDIEKIRTLALAAKGVR